MLKYKSFIQTETEFAMRKVKRFDEITNKQQLA